MHAKKLLLAGLALLAATTAAGLAGEKAASPAFKRVESPGAPAEFGWIKRSGYKLPAFKSEKVRYSFYVLGEGKKSVLTLAWDESQGTGKGYDTLYADKNFNADLTEEGERFVWENPADPKKAERGAFERYDLGKLKEADGAAVYEFALNSCYSNDELTYPTEIKVHDPKGSYAVGCIPGNIKLRWSNDLQTAPVYWLGGSALPCILGKKPGESLGTLEAGRSFHAWYDVSLHGGDAQSRLLFAFSTIGGTGQPQTLLRVLGKDGNVLEELPFVGGCACGGAYGQELLIPCRVPPGRHEIVARCKRPESLGGPAEFIYPVEIANPDFGKPLQDPAFAALKQAHPQARIVSLRRAANEQEAMPAHPGETLAPAKVEDNHLMQDSLLYQNNGADRVLLIGTRQGDGRAHDHHMLLRFDLSALPKDAKILGAQARLTLVASDQYSQLSDGAAIEAYAMRRGWIEKIERNVHETPYSNWHGPAMLYQRDKVEKWAKPGADDPEVDRFPQAAANVEVGVFPRQLDAAARDPKAPREPRRLVALDLTALARQWHAGELPNHGVLLKLKGKLSTYVCASEFPDYPFRPTLVIAYEGGAPLKVAAVAQEEDLAAAVSRAQASGRPLLVKVYSPLCGACKQAETTVYADANVRQALQTRFETVRLKIEEHAGLVGGWGVGAVPAAVVLTPDGRTRKALLNAAELGDAKQFLNALDAAK